MPRRAGSFDELTRLLRLAGQRLRAQGLDLPQRLRCLRGLYYGSRHSLDYERRRSRVRNWGFNCYLQSLPPADPTPWLGADLARALKDSAVVHDGGRCLDVGHVIIGLEARQRRFTRLCPIPSQGGSGLQLATWLGDLGGAAGLLALARLDDPATRARDLLFNPARYDLRPNLEGDLAAHLVAADSGAAGGPLVLDAPTVGDALHDYLQHGWERRFHRFAPLVGATVAEGQLSQPQRLRLDLQAKVSSFATTYTLVRLGQQGRLRRGALRQAAAHVGGAATELCEVFVGWLAQGLAGGVGAVDLPDPEPQAPGPAQGLLAWLGPCCPA
jgi:hypothetical protein